MPTNTPPFDAVLNQALEGLDNDDVRLFYDYFEVLKAKVGSQLANKVKVGVGESAVLQSALLSMFEDIGNLNIPLGECDDTGRPMHWPLLLSYIERHCDKWNKYYQTKKRGGKVVSFSGSNDAQGIDPADPKGIFVDEAQVNEACDQLFRHLSAQERTVFEHWVEGKSLAESAEKLDCSEAKVSYVRKRIRDLLVSE